jgi:hypothetical protein
MVVVVLIPLADGEERSIWLTEADRWGNCAMAANWGNPIQVSLLFRVFSSYLQCNTCMHACMYVCKSRTDCSSQQALPLERVAVTISGIVSFRDRSHG